MTPAHAVSPAPRRSLAVFAATLAVGVGVPSGAGASAHAARAASARRAGRRRRVITQAYATRGRETTARRPAYGAELPGMAANTAASPVSPTISTL